MTDAVPIVEAVVTAGSDGTAVLKGDRLDYALAQLGLHVDEISVRMLAGELGVDASAFEMRIGQWQLNAPVAVARAVVNGAVLTAALAATGDTSIPITVLSVIVPLVFDLDRVTVSASDRAVYIDLLRQVPNRQLIEDWYASLDSDIRAEITSLEFRDLIERLEGAGLASSDEFDVLVVDPPTGGDRRRLRLS